MKIIEINAFTNGAHRNQSGANVLPEGWAIIPDDIIIPKSFPFVDIEVDGNIVTSITAREVPKPDISIIKQSKLDEIKQACEAYIYAGTNVTLPDNTVEHFTYTLADQSNVSEMFTAILAGATEYPYHADGEICKIYSKDEIVTIYGTLSLFKTEATTYHNSLKSQINGMTDADAISAIKFKETVLTGEYLTNYTEMMTSAQTQLNAILSKIPSDEVSES